MIPNLKSPISRSSRLRAGVWLALTAAGLVCATDRARAGSLDQALSAYDTAITADATAALAKLTTPVTLDGKAGSPFDFGATSGDTTMEFILQGDPVANGDSAFLAVGENTASSLRYEQYQNTHQLGFTQGGVADYQFDPGVPSPVNPTHLAFVWSATDLTLTLYVDGALAGTITEVSDAFALPSGAGFLGNNPTGTEGMIGTIYRVTVYPGSLTEAQIKSHADPFVNARGPLANITSFAAAPGEIDSQGSAVLSWQVQNATTLYLNNEKVTGTSKTVSPAVTTTYTLVASNDISKVTATAKVLVNPRLDVYDSSIAADTAGGLTPLTILTNTVNLTGTAGEPFDFGPTSGDTTMEFILEGDPEATGGSGFLAVGENTTSSLRYEQWENSHQLGFTQGGVADYLFAPGVPSPTIATHVVWVWNSATFSMTVYVNGVAKGTINNVSDSFAMPYGMGYLGANATGGELMVGRIFRLVVYSGVVPEATIKKHAEAFTSVLRPPIINSFTATPNEILGQGSTTLAWDVQAATAVFLDGVDVKGATSQTVSPAVTTTYTLVASNSITTVSSKLTVYVTPKLEKYDAAITADTAGGLTPLATLTNPVALTGAGLVPFDFGAGSGSDTTLEFILEGDPTAGVDAYLAVGADSSCSLRYAQYSNTRQMGFTQMGVADYLFSPAIASPTVPTHVTYVWNAAALTMSLYTNGVLASTKTDVSDTFTMPYGAGYLGSTPTGGEAMVGRIFRIVVYAGVVSDATIQKHGNAFVSALPTPAHPASLAIALSGSQAAITLQGQTGAHYRVEYCDSLTAPASWQLLQDIPSLSGTSVQVTDPAVASHSQRFYRAVQLP